MARDVKRRLGHLEDRVFGLAGDGAGLPAVTRAQATEMLTLEANKVEREGDLPGAQRLRGLVARARRETRAAITNAELDAWALDEERSGAAERASALRRFRSEGFAEASTP